MRIKADYSRVSVPVESGNLGKHDCGEMFHFGQESPGWPVVALLRNLKRWYRLAGQTG